MNSEMTAKEALQLINDHRSNERYVVQNRDERRILIEAMKYLFENNHKAYTDKILMENVRS